VIEARSRGVLDRSVKPGDDSGVLESNALHRHVTKRRI
jgi:hypothetical protein